MKSTPSPMTLRPQRDLFFHTKTTGKKYGIPYERIIAQLDKGQEDLDSDFLAQELLRSYLAKKNKIARMRTQKGTVLIKSHQDELGLLLGFRKQSCRISLDSQLNDDQQEVLLKSPTTQRTRVFYKMADVKVRRRERSSMFTLFQEKSNTRVFKKVSPILRDAKRVKETLKIPTKTVDQVTANLTRPIVVQKITEKEKRYSARYALQGNSANEVFLAFLKELSGVANVEKCADENFEFSHLVAASLIDNADDLLLLKGVVETASANTLQKMLEDPIRLLLLLKKIKHDRLQFKSEVVYYDDKEQKALPIPKSVTSTVCAQIDRGDTATLEFFRESMVVEKPNQGLQDVMSSMVHRVLANHSPKRKVPGLRV